MAGIVARAGGSVNAHGPPGSPLDEACEQLVRKESAAAGQDEPVAWPVLEEPGLECPRERFGESRVVERIGRQAVARAKGEDRPLGFRAVVPRS